MGKRLVNNVTITSHHRLVALAHKEQVPNQQQLLEFYKCILHTECMFPLVNVSACHMWHLQSTSLFFHYNYTQTYFNIHGP